MTETGDEFVRNSVDACAGLIESNFWTVFDDDGYLEEIEDITASLMPRDMELVTDEALAEFDRIRDTVTTRAIFEAVHRILTSDRLLDTIANAGLGLPREREGE